MKGWQLQIVAHYFDHIPNLASQITLINYCHKLNVPIYIAEKQFFVNFCEN